MERDTGLGSSNLPAVLEKPGSRAVFNGASATDVVLGTDYYGTQLLTGLPMFRSGAGTTGVTVGNMGKNLIDWNKNLGLLEFALKFGAELNNGIMGPAVCFMANTDINMGTSNGTVVVKDDAYRVGFLMGFVATLRIDFKLWFWAPWDCQWHSLVDQAAAVNIDLIDVLIKILGFAYSKTAKPAGNASAAQKAKYESNKQLFSLAGFFNGLWNFTEYGRQTWAASSRTIGSFNFSPGYAFELKWSPWAGLGPVIAGIIDTIGSKVGVSMSLYAQVRLDFPGEVWPKSFLIQGVEYTIASHDYTTVPDGPSTRTVKRYQLTTTTPRSSANFTDVKFKVGVKTDCLPRLIIGCTIELLHVKVFDPRYELSLWSIIGFNPALWERDATVNQCTDRSRFLSEREGEVIDAEPLEVVFEPPLVEAVA